MNSKQRLVLLIAFFALTLIFVYPPYSVDSGLIGGTVYVFFRRPPVPSDMPLYNVWLLLWEIAWALGSAAAAWVALDNRTAPRPRQLFSESFLLQIAFFVHSIPSFRGILEPEFTWLIMNVLAAATSALMFVLIKKARRATITPTGAGIV